MASNPSFQDLQWLIQAIKSDTVNLQNISFYLSQQPTSKCFQETENSFTVHISKDDQLCFSNLLQVLIASKHTRSLLRNLECHQVVWEPNQLRDLRMLLESRSSVKQLLFQRNVFDKECLLELSDVLKRSGVVKEIMICESGIGSSGAVLLANALKENDNLEELQIWDDSIGSNGADEFSKMIEVNSTLKQLTIFDSNSSIATPLISGNGTLRIYKLDFSGSCTVTCTLGWNTTVKSVDLSGVHLKSQWAKEFRWILEQNQNLIEVNLSNTCLKDKGVVYVSAGLFKNKSLQSLSMDGNWFNGIGVEHLLTPLSRFSSQQNQANVTLKSVTFGGGKTKIGRDGLAAILQMLTTNQSVTRLGIYNDMSLKAEDFIKIFKRMEKNVSLRYLSLQGCKGVAGELVLQTIMETLQVNPWIEEMDLSRTPLHNSGMSNAIYHKLGQNGTTEPEMDSLKDMNMTAPKSCRVFFFGQEYAGKTTLCNSISQNLSSSKHAYIDQVRNLVQPVEEAVKSVGMKIKTFKDRDNKISIWNLPTRYEFYPLHDLMFPGHGSASCFFIISSFYRKPNNREPKNAIEIEEDLQFWLRFVVSNSRRAVQQCMLPNVTIVLTHFDQINQPSNNFQAIASSIQRLKDKFQGFVEFYPTVFTVDARSSVSVTKLTHHLKKTSNAILQRVPRVYELCNDLILVNINGIYIRVELGGQFGYYIDILACSTKNLTETLRHLQQLIIPAIHGLCNGVTLNENILRQECVKILMPPRYRRTQFLSLQKLKNALLLVPAESMYDYQHTWSSVTDSGRQILGLGFDYARDLLSDDDFREVLHRRYHDLHNLAQELQDPSVNHQNNASSTGEGQEQEHDSKIEPTFGGIAKGLEQVLQRLKIIEKEIRNVKQEIEGLRYYEHRLLIELHQKMNFLVTYTVQIEERTVPNMFYFVETENYSRKLVTNMIPGMTALRLHMLCEYRNEMHVVEDQLGCEIMQIDNKSIKCLAPYMKKFMKLLTFALKIGAHLAAGMGEMIPDLSKEISHLASSSMVYGATGAAAAGALGAMAVGSRTREVDTLQDQRIAQQWVLDFLREHQCSTGKEIAEKFGLWRVRYRDSGQIAWICRRHIIHRAHDIFEVPI